MSFYQFSSYSVSSSNGETKKEQKFEYKDNKKHLKGELKQNYDGKKKYESMFKSIDDFESEINEKLWGLSENESQWKMKKIEKDNVMTLSEELKID